MICSDAHTQSHSCWCKLFEWIRLEWIRTGGIRVEDTYWWDMYWWDTFAIPADAHLLNGYVCNGHVLVGYVWNGYVWNGYVWDMYDVLDMYGILVVIGGIRITTFWMDTHCMDTYWWDTYVWDTFGMDMCGICAMCWICVGYVWWIRLKWICVGYVKCAGYVWDMCGVRYANNLLKNPATKRLSGKNMFFLRETINLLVGGWTNPFQKNLRQNGNSCPILVRGWKLKQIFETTTQAWCLMIFEGNHLFLFPDAAWVHWRVSFLEGWFHDFSVDLLQKVIEKMKFWAREC